MCSWVSNICFIAIMLFCCSLWTQQSPHSLSSFCYSVSRSPSRTPQIHWSHLSALELWGSPSCDWLPQQCGVFHGWAWPQRRIPSGWRHGDPPRDVRRCDRDSAWQQCLWHFVCVWGQVGIRREWQGGQSHPRLSPAPWIMTPEKGWGDDFPGVEQRFSKDFFHFNLFVHAGQPAVSETCWERSDMEKYISLQELNECVCGDFLLSCTVLKLK